MKGDLADRGEPSGLSERKVGDLLTAPGLTTRTRTNAGYVLLLIRDHRLRIHDLARDHEIDAISTEPIQSCDICGEPSETSVSSSPGSGPEQCLRRRTGA
jgi:hypothetical protein